MPLAMFVVKEQSNRRWLVVQRVRRSSPRSADALLPVGCLLGGGEDSAILPPSAIPQYRPRRCKPTTTLEEPGSVEWLIAQSEGVRRSMSMKKKS